MIDKELWQTVFEDSELTRRYFDICSTPSNDETTERHHILPKSIWPEFEKCEWNIVELSLKNHYTVHEMLPDMCVCTNSRRKMLDAWWFISHIKGVKVDADTYARLKEEYVSLSIGRLLTLETRKKLSAAKKGKRPNNADTPKSLETRRKMSEARKGEKHHFYGKSHTDEVKSKISSKKKGSKLTQETKNKMSVARKGVSKGPMAQETKDKLSKAHLGKKLSDETKRKMALIRLGVPMADEIKAKLAVTKIAEAKAKSPKVLCVEKGIIFDSVRDAAEFIIEHRTVKIHNVITCISEVCRHKVGSKGKIRLTAYGYKWEYLTM